MSLSDKIHSVHQIENEQPEFIWVEDVRESVRKIKERIEKDILGKDLPMQKDIEKIIDEEMGEKLI